MKTKTVKYLDTENEIWKKHLVFIARFYVKLKAYLPILIFVFLVFVTNSPFQLFESKQYSHQCVRYFTFWSLGHSFAFLFLSSTRNIRGISEEESSRCFSYSHIYSLIHPTMIHPRALSSFLVIFATIAASSAEQRLVRRVLGDVSALDLPFAARIMFP